MSAMCCFSLLPTKKETFMLLSVSVFDAQCIYNVLELWKRAFVPQRTMKAVVHPSPFTATAPLSKPRPVVVVCWRVGLGHKGLRGFLKQCDIFCDTFLFRLNSNTTPPGYSFYSLRWSFQINSWLFLPESRWWNQIWTTSNSPCTDSSSALSY